MNIRGNSGFKKPDGGYTILEVMIFVAVSSLIFVSAVGAINGRQQQVQFAQSVRDFEAKMRDVINDVTTGYFPTRNDILCSVSAGGILELSSASADLGTSPDCLFVGKALVFSPGASSGQNFSVYNLIGKRYGSGNRPVSNINEASPKVMVPDSGGIDTAVVQELRYGVYVKKVYELDTPANDFKVIGILSQFEGSSGSNGQTVQIGGVTSTSSNVLNDLRSININIGTNGYINTQSRGVVICLSDTNDRIASLTIGSGGESSVVLKIDDHEVDCL